MHRQVADLRDSMRPSHTLARATDGSLYVSMGQYDISQCPAPAPRQGAVLRIGQGMPLTGETYTAGFRNPMWLRCKEWGACYGAELTGDGWDAIGGREKLVELRRGDDYTILNTEVPNAAYAPEKLSMERTESAFSPEDRIGALHMQTLGILDNRARLVDQLGALGAIAGAAPGDVQKLLGA